MARNVEKEDLDKQSLVELKAALSWYAAQSSLNILFAVQGYKNYIRANCSRSGDGGGDAGWWLGL